MEARTSNSLERVNRACKIEWRAKRMGDDGQDAAGDGIADERGRTVFGYAAVFNSESEYMGFTELIEPGAFTEALKKSDIRALFNHDASLILARTSASTLTVKEDKKGLYYEFECPNTSYGNDLLESIKLGNIKESSFAFIVKRQQWDEVTDSATQKTTYTRRILEVEEIFDISPVTYPAYTDTDADCRNILIEARNKGFLLPEKPEHKSDNGWNDFFQAAKSHT